MKALLQPKIEAFWIWVREVSPVPFQVTLILGLLVALALTPFVWNFEERDQPTRLAPRGYLRAASMLEALEYRLYDQRFTLRGAQHPASKNRIAIVALNANSLGIIGRWPWPRNLHARLIRRLKRAGAQVVALDFDFSSRQNPGKNGELSPADAALVKAAREAKTAIFPSLFQPHEVTERDGDKGASVHSFVAPFGEDEAGRPGLDEQTIDLSLVYLPQDSDGGYRRYPFQGVVGGEQIGSFATLACALSQGYYKGEGEVYRHLLKQNIWPNKFQKSQEIPIRSAAFDGRDAPSFDHLLINFWEPNRTFPTYSYSDVLSVYDDAALKRYFGGRIVFVGATSLILKDLFPVTHIGDQQSSSIPGVEIHASVAAMLLDGTFLKFPSPNSTLFNLFLLSVGGAAWTYAIRGSVGRMSRRAQEKWGRRRSLGNLRFRIQDGVWLALYAPLTLVPALAFWVFCVWRFQTGGAWVVAIYPLLGTFLSSGLVLLFLFTLETSERRKLMSQLGLYFDKGILDEILAHPEEEYAVSKRVRATVMFTDLRGFTFYSEQHDVGEAISALNSYMTRMIPLVSKHGGTVDKLIGDAIMAFFGAPLPHDDHAASALRCALEMQEECAKFRRETGIQFFTRIGIHTGEVIAGPLGSLGDADNSAFMNYTVIGDTVNLASRLEGKNKEFGSWVMCSLATLEAAPGVVNAENARAMVAGKSGEIEVAIVRGPINQPPQDEYWGS